MQYVIKHVMVCLLINNEPARTCPVTTSFTLDLEAKTVSESVFSPTKLQVN